MRAWVAVLAVGLAGCCTGPRAKPAPVADLSEPVTVQAIERSKAVATFATEGECITFFGKLVKEDWIAISEMKSCDVRGSVRGTLTRRGQTCVRVTLEDGACKGARWVVSDYAVARKGK